MLLDWLREAKIDRAGCFKYEPVAGAPANDIAEPVPQEVKEERWHRFMRAQQEISAAKLCKEGRQAPAGASSTKPGATVAKGRSKYDAPEIDGAVHIQSRRPLRAGEIVTVKIDRADAYDLHGRRGVAHLSRRERSRRRESAVRVRGCALCGEGSPLTRSPSGRVGLSLRERLTPPPRW